MFQLIKHKDEFQIQLSPEIFNSFGIELVNFLSHKGFENVSFEDSGLLRVIGSKKEARQVSMLSRAFLHSLNH